MIGLPIWWARQAPMLSVHQSLDRQSGRMTVAGVVEPPMSEVNEALRALDYGDAQLSHFRLSDETGMMDVYFDPENFALPLSGTRIQMVGRKERGPNQAFVFIASELVVAPN